MKRMRIHLEVDVDEHMPQSEFNDWALAQAKLIAPDHHSSVFGSGTGFVLVFVGTERVVPAFDVDLFDQRSRPYTIAR